MKKEKKGGGKLIAIGLIVIIFGAVLGYLFMRIELDYKRNGIPITAVVTSCVEGERNSEVRGKYIGDDGIEHQVKIANLPSPEIGQTVEGLMLPDEPEIVYVSPGTMKKFLFLSIVTVVEVLGVMLIFAAVSANMRDSRFEKESSFTRGTVLNVTVSGTQKDRRYISQIRYTDDEGNQQIFEFVSDVNIHHVGDTVSVRYAKRRNGKYHSEVI